MPRLLQVENGFTPTCNITCFTWISGDVSWTCEICHPLLISSSSTPPSLQRSHGQKELHLLLSGNCLVHGVIAYVSIWKSSGFCNSSRFSRMVSDSFWLQHGALLALNDVECPHDFLSPKLWRISSDPGACVFPKSS